ncbi:aspartyl/glutamyl-tRNA(Asn/Gln) amidotransferase subunit A [Cyclonatronum proteinivorum]|uniref:Glutamyl-tRNA(Gln) amidotransferase subunit A n=1 Tax=Cyclonatronum proteinivorum TaxID=1457365 RepID=A0A345UN42_9BACT|nr:Asp-tRNA(Asn)/Glu-tRNA(Gln) amidotransferase subunit GatA [Cyclonatronum proteinivorum]AXJ01894.1 aspartyl/glutamyl-tRNA(Asn/Gln) amidotransferase subunit A [Cyclonatronum proteinivorum]
MQPTGIRETQRLIAEGALTAEQITGHFLETIERDNPELNAFTTIAGTQAMQQARETDQQFWDRKAGRLAGAVIGIKEAIVERGRVCTAGSKMLAGFESVYDATAVQRLRDEGAILIGRLNMDEFAMGSSTENSAFGITRNPADKTKVPGGSSGGSAAAVAAGMCHATLGSDTGGSVRQPASLCGVVGLKPTYGRISRHGLIAYASSFDCIGPLTHSVEDAALLLSVLAGHDHSDATSSRKPVPDYLAESETLPQGLRVGLPVEYFGDGLDPEVKALVMQQVEALKAAGAVPVPLSLPHTPYAVATYYILATAEASSNLARYDGIRYGHRTDRAQMMEALANEKKMLQKAGQDPASVESALIRLYKQSRTEGFGPEVKRRIMLGTYVLSAGYYDAYYGKAQRIRRLIQQDFLSAFEHCDVILSPTSPTTAFGIGEKTDDPLQMYLSDIYTISANLAGIPALSLPAGTHPADGLPVGVQLMAPHFREDLLFAAGRQLEQHQATTTRA